MFVCAKNTIFFSIGGTACSSLVVHPNFCQTSEHLHNDKAVSSLILWRWSVSYISRSAATSISSIPVSLSLNSPQKSLSCLYDLALGTVVFPKVQGERSFSSTPRLPSLQSVLVVGQTDSWAWCHGEECASDTGGKLCDHRPKVGGPCRLGNERLHCKLYIPRLSEREIIFRFLFIKKLSKINYNERLFLHKRY